MGDRFRMTLRRKPGSSSATSPIRCRRNVAPPKKDDLSVLTWKEQQMIEKAQLASLKTATTQKRVQAKKRGRPRKYQLAQVEEDEDSSSSSEEASSDNDDATSDSPSTPPPPLSPLSVFTSGKMSRAGRGRSSKNGTRRSSSRRSPSGQSLGSIGSFPDLLSPYLPTTTTSGGFAARKSAYTGVIGSSDDEDEFATRRRGQLDSLLRCDRDSSDEEDAHHASSRRLPPEEFMPATEDFISFLVLKGVNCVPEELKYIGNLPWETIPLKRKSNSSCAKKTNDGAGGTNITSPVSPVLPPVIVKPEQAWAKKAIERAKRSLVVKTRHQPNGKAAVNSKLSPPNAAVRSETTSKIGRSRNSSNGKSFGKQERKDPKRSLNSKQRGVSGRVKSQPSKKTHQGYSKASFR